MASLPRVRGATLAVQRVYRAANGTACTRMGGAVMTSCCVAFSILLKGERGHQRLQTFGPALQKKDAGALCVMTGISGGWI